MALQLNKELPSGVIANYYKACEPKIDSSSKGGTCVVKLYLNFAARNANKKELVNKVYVIPEGVFSSLNLANTDARSLVYTYLKTLPEFTGAIDV